VLIKHLDEQKKKSTVLVTIYAKTPNELSTLVKSSLAPTQTETQEDGKNKDK
jgi:hypothetical protein